MAFIDDEKLKQDENTALGGGGSQSISGGGSSDVSSVAGKGRGSGVGAGFTNIQSYMKANQGDSSAADQLNKYVGSEYDKEKSAIDAGSKTAVDESNKGKGSDYTIANAEKDIADASGQYQWNDANKNANVSIGRGTSQKATQTTRADSVDKDGQNYLDNLSKGQEYLSREYKGPKSWNYGIGTQSQKYNDQLRSDDAFQGLMKDVYNKKAMQNLSAGQSALQQQLNVSNEKLGQARKDLSNKFSGLNEYNQNAIKSTNETLQGNEESLRKGQNALKDWLYGQKDSANQESQTIDQATSQRARDLSSGKIPSGWNDGQARYTPFASEAPRARYNTILDFLGDKDTARMVHNFNPDGGGDPIARYGDAAPVAPPKAPVPEKGGISTGGDGVDAGRINGTINDIIAPEDAFHRAIGIPTPKESFNNLRGFLGL